MPSCRRIDCLKFAPGAVAIVFLAGMSILVTTVGGAEPAAAVASLQQDHGLLRRGQRVWILPAEDELQKVHAALPRQRERVVLLERDFDGAIESRLRAWQAGQPVVAALKQSLGRLATDDPQRETLARQIEGLEATLVEPERLGSHPELRGKAIQLAAERCELLRKVAWARTTWAALQRDYAQLASDSEVAALLSQAGERQRLGPAAKYQADIARLAEYERSAATSWAPLFQQSGQTRIMGLIDERTSATFTWGEASDQPTLITSATAEAGSIEFPADAPVVPVLIAPGRTVMAQAVTLASLRFGGCKLEQVPAYVLPPEAEDCGNRLGLPGFGKYRVRFQPERLRVWIDEP